MLFVIRVHAIPIARVGRPWSSIDKLNSCQSVGLTGLSGWPFEVGSHGASCLIRWRSVEEYHRGRLYVVFKRDVGSHTVFLSSMDSRMTYQTPQMPRLPTHPFECLRLIQIPACIVCGEPTYFYCGGCRDSPAFCSSGHFMEVCPVCRATVGSFAQCLAAL